MSETEPAGTVAPRCCLNCGETLDRRFCAECGQDSRRKRITVRHLVATAGNVLTTMDSSAWASLKGLATQPGEWIGDFVDGKRVSKLPPFRFWFSATVLYLVVAALLDVDIFGATSTLRELYEEGTFANMPDERQERMRAVRAISTLLMDNMQFLLVATPPLLAVALRGMYRKSRRNVAEAVVLILFTRGFLNVALAPALALEPASPAAWMLVTTTLSVAYMAWAFVGFYGGNWFGAVAKGLVLEFTFQLLASIIAFAPMIYWLLT